ncbi:unnamed protein product [Meloidogyne enterolobii]|uniref:Uncharacterized protein n=1 Tax=Meloidogyne enterolobii TaxID=390850 RepID=A0ACB0YTM6_MELEN
MAVDVNSALNRAYEELRNIDLDLSTLSGVQDRFSTRKRSANDSGNVTNTSNDRRILDGGRRIIVGPEGSAKRSRHDDDPWNEQHQHNRYPQRDYSPPSLRPQRTLSSVIMSSTSGASTIETKSRTAVITEKKKSETKEDAVRNRRLFSNLLVGTLRQFQKEEKTVGVKGQAQLEKQREVERRLEENEKENRERLLRERDSLMEKRRDKEMQIQALRRQKAIEQSAEEKTKHFQRLACFIQTQTKPPLFFLPSKHTLRTLELLKDSSKKIETLIELRREEMDRELKRLGTYIIGGNGVVMKQEIEEDSDDENSKQRNGGSGHPLKSTIVVKKEQQQIDENEVNIGPIIVSSANRENNKNMEGEGGEEETSLQPTKSVVIDGDEEEGNNDNIEDNNNNVIDDVAVNTDRNGDNDNAFEGQDESGGNI